MKKYMLMLFIPLVMVSGCSSIPKKERVTPVIAQKEKASLSLDRGHNEYRWNSFDSALHLYGNAFTAASAVDWQEGMIRSLIHMSRTYDRLGDSQSSRLYLDRASGLLDADTAPELLVMVSNRKTEWFFFNATPEEALKQNDLSLTQAGGLDSEEAGEAWRIRASIFKTMKNYDQAMDAVLKALEIDEKRNFIPETASDYYIMSSLYSLQGNYGSAVDSMESALAKDKYIENTPAIAQDLYALGLIYEKAGDRENAARYYARSFLVYTAADRNTVPSALLQKMEQSSSGELWTMTADEL